MDKLRFKECINYPLFFSKHPNQLTKPLKAWEKVIGTLAFVALTLLAGSFFYIKGLRVKVTKNVPQPMQAQKVSEVVKPSLEPKPKDSNPKTLQNSGSGAQDLPPSTNPTDPKKSAADNSPTTPVIFNGVEALIDSLQLNPLSNAQTPQAIKELSQCPEEGKKILSQFLTDLDSALQQLMRGHQTSLGNDRFTIESYRDSRELISYRISLKIKLAIDILGDGNMQGTFQFESCEYVFKGISGFSFEEALRAYLSLKYSNFEARINSRAQLRKLALRPYLKKPAAWAEMDTTQRKEFENTLLHLIKQSKCEESSVNLIYGQIQKCSTYELQALQVLLITFEQTFKTYSSNPQEILKGSIRMYPSKNHANNLEYGHIFTLTTTSLVDPSTAFPIASIELEKQKFYFEDLSIFAMMRILKGATPKASNIFHLQEDASGDPISKDGFSFAIS